MNGLMRRWTSLGIAVFGLYMNSSCGLDIGATRPAEPEAYSLDGTKWIHANINDGYDSRTMLRSQYAVSPSGRLLLRLESLEEKASSISLAEGRRVYVDVALSAGEEPAGAIATLVVCPVVKNWMKLATWSRAHPMPGGDWINDGGDFDSSACLRGALTKVDAVDILRFDVTQWIIDYVKGRGQNFGLIMISNGGEVIVQGDANSMYSPRISWLRE